MKKESKVMIHTFSKYDFDVPESKKMSRYSELGSSLKRL
jgi:hypothetical protein